MNFIHISFLLLCAALSTSAQTTTQTRKTTNGGERTASQTEHLTSDLPEAPSALVAGEYSDPLPVVLQNTDGTLRKIMPGGYSVLYKDPKGERKVINKAFLIGHGVYLASVVLDVETTHQGLAHHKCVEGGGNDDAHPSRGHLYANDLAYLAGFTAIDYMLGLTHPPKWFPIQFEAAGAGTALHIKGATKWYTECW